MDRPRLNFPSYTFRLSQRGGQNYIWDALRGCWLCLTPEEWVRQHVLCWLCESKGMAPQLIVQEHPVAVCGMPQRADIVIFGSDARPVMLVECKAPQAGIGPAALDQAVRYNSILGARYIMLTDGMKHYFYERTPDGDYLPLESIPEI